MTEQEVTTDSESEQSLSDAVAELRDIEQRRKTLETAISQRKRDFLMEVVSVVKKYITDNGYEVAEIAKHLVPAQRAKGKRKSSTGTGPGRVYALNNNPALTYTKGVIPGWMKTEMTCNGYDVADAAARNEFRAKHMHVVGVSEEPKEVPAAEPVAEAA